MNFFDIFSKLEKADPEILNRLDSRRDILNRLGNMSKKAALAAAPIALGSLFNKALAGTNDAVTDVLNYALTLEYLEEAFYTQAIDSGKIPTGAPLTALTLIKKHESAHVVLLKNALGTNNTVGTPTFDFGAAFDTYESLLTYAQAFEDAGVRAYKGKAGVLLNNPVLTVALQIHSVEARHAAHIRMMRRGAAGGGITTQAGWITNGEANGAPAAIYGAGSPATTFPSEGNTTQAGVNLTSGLGTMYTAAEVSEAFDEALDGATILNIVDPFIVK